MIEAMEGILMGKLPWKEIKSIIERFDNPEKQARLEIIIEGDSVFCGLVMKAVEGIIIEWESNNGFRAI